MNLANLKRTLKFDYLAFLSITRSFFKNKNFLKHFGFIYGLYFVGIFRFLTSDVLYRDDAARVNEPYTQFAQVGRHLAEYLTHLVHMNFPMLNYISPITQLIAIALLSLASMALVKIVNKKITYWGLLASLAIGLSPFYLENLSYKFDSPYMALATLCAILPFLFVKRLSLFFIASVLFLLCMWNLYQASNGVYIILSMFIVLNLILSKHSLKQILKFCFIATISFILAVIVYKFIIHFATNISPYGNTSSQIISSFNDLKQNIKNFISTIVFYNNNQTIKLFYITCLLFFIITITSNKIKFYTILTVLLFLIFGFFANFGFMYILSNLVFSPRIFIGIGIFCAILLISISDSKYKILNFFSKIIIIVFSYNLYIMSSAYINAAIIQNQYYDFRINQTYSFLQNNPNYKDYIIQIDNGIHKTNNNEYIGTTRALANEIEYFPLIGYMTYSDWNFIHRHIYYNLNHKTCKPANKIPVDIIDTKFNKFEIYDNKCIKISYKIGEPFTYTANFSKYKLKKSKILIQDYALNDNLKFSLYNNDAADRVGLNTLFFEFDKKIPAIAKKDDVILAIHIYIKGEKSYLVADKKINDFKNIGNKYYYTVGLANIDIKNIEKIWIGFYNRKRNSAQFNIDVVKEKSKLQIKQLEHLSNFTNQHSIDVNNTTFSIYSNKLEQPSYFFHRKNKNIFSFYRNPLILESKQNFANDTTLSIDVNNKGLIRNNDLIQANNKFYYVFDLKNIDINDIDTIYFPQFSNTIRLKEQIKLKNYLISPIFIKKDIALKDDLKISILQGNNKFFEKDSLIFEFNKNVKEVAEKSENILFVHLFVTGKEKYIIADKNINNFTQIGNKFYHIIDTKDEKFKNLEKINFGFYDSNAKKNSAKFSVNLKENSPK